MLGSTNKSAILSAFDSALFAPKVPGASSASTLRQPATKAVSRCPNGTDPGVPDSAATGPGGAGRASELTAVVESEIIPRLMLAHATDPGRGAQPGAGVGDIDADAVDAFARLALTSDPEQMLAFVSRLMAGGRSVDEIYRDLLAPAARQLGTYWNDDLVAYSDVTIALGRLQHLIRLMGWQMAPGRELAQTGRAALFAPAPGEQHIFGLILVEDSFRRAGWRTWLETDVEHDPVGQTVAQHWFDVVGFSLGNLGMVDRLADTIRQVRRTSKNREIFVLVGGSVLKNDPDLFKALGADATAADGAEALTLAEERVCHRA